VLGAQPAPPSFARPQAGEGASMRN
jgi:hypothetical protein